MATGRKSFSVLENLMGIDRLSTPHTTHQRQRVLSDGYLQNIASVASRKRSLLELDEDDFSMAVDGHQATKDAIEASEERVNIFGSNSSVNNKLEEVEFLPRDQGFELFGGFDKSWFTSSGSSSASTGRKQELSRTLTQLSPSQKRTKSGSLTPHSLNYWVKEESDYSPNYKAVELNKQNGKSHLHLRSSSSPSSLSDGRKRKFTSSVRNKEIGAQSLRVTGLSNGREFPMRIAEQITSQVKHSAWHSYSDISVSRNVKSSAQENEETIHSSSCLVEPENKHDMSSFKPVTELSCEKTQESKKQLPERWKTRNRFQEVRWVAAARYLSKPTHFPSAWIPSSRTRHFTLDRKWCLKSGKRDSTRCNDSMAESFSNLRTGSELNGYLDLEKHDVNLEASSTLEQSERLGEQTVVDEFSAARESFSDRSSVSDVESLIYHEAAVSLSEGQDILEEQLSQQDSVVPLSLISMDTEHVDDQENEKKVPSVQLQSEPSEPSACILLEDGGSVFQGFRLKHQLKDSAVFEPVSPVSSLEGPESCRLRPNLTLVSKEIPSISECLEKNVHGLQAKLQLIEAVSLESGSEGPGMIVSSEDGEEASSVGFYREDSQIMGIYGTSETRDFSYLVDVLAELGLPTGDLDIERETWCSQGHALSPSVFDTLEKKYGKQTFWERAERRLLFDRINSGLIDITQPSVGLNSWRKPVVKRLSIDPNRWEFIEEELWNLLVIQEEEYRRDSSDNKLWLMWKGCLDLEEDTDFIAQELEFLLIDELVEEFVEMEVLSS